MSDAVDVSNSSSTSVGSTVNPQQLNSSSSQLQSSNNASSLGISTGSGNTITLKNFSLSTLSLSGQPSGSAVPYSSTSSNNHLSPTAIVIICVFIVAAIAALILANRSTKITTNK